MKQKMEVYPIVKTIHILSSVLMVGTGFGSAFYFFFVNRSGSVQTIAVIARLIVRADWWFTTPTIIIQPISGFWLMHLGGWSLTTPWMIWAIVLYCFAVLCWLPVVWLQIQMRNMAMTHQMLPLRYWQYLKYWKRLGYPAFFCMLVIYSLMIVKPAFG